MQIALCTSFMEMDALAQGIYDAIPDLPLHIDEYHNITMFLQSTCLSCYDIAIIALDGAKGLEAVTMARERMKMLPIIWISDDESFAQISYRLQVAMFLSKRCTTSELQQAICRSLEWRYKSCK